MEDQLEAQLRESHPRFFGNLRGSCSCGDGWYGIILWAAEQYEALAEKYGIEIYATQVKEKFGCLEIYINMGKDSAWAVCREEATAISQEVRCRSLNVCERCGATGEDAGIETKASRGRWWIRTLCLSCRVVDEAGETDTERARAVLERLRENLAAEEEKSD